MDAASFAMSDGKEKSNEGTLRRDCTEAKVTKRNKDMKDSSDGSNMVGLAEVRV